MSRNPVIQIEISDNDLQFRRKCNQNFLQLARQLTPAAQQIQLIADSDVIVSIQTAMADKATVAELTQTEAELTNLINGRLRPTNIVAGSGIGVSVDGMNVTIRALCPIPVNGIYFHDDVSVTDPATLPGWSGTTWAAVTQSAIPAQAWKRLT